jgi:segregation and condensation protein A
MNSAHDPHDETPLSPPEMLEPRETGFELRLPQFEGALDLLLYLVRSQGLDILDIPIVDVARQYNAYLDRMRELDLEVASEYLVMAATLAYIKSQMMLPRPKGEEGEQDDPRQELVEQLLEYEKYKKAAESLGAMDVRRDLVYVRDTAPPKELTEVETVQATLSDLVTAFERVLERLEGEDINQVIRRDNFSIVDMMERLVKVLPVGGQVSFRELLAVCRSRLERVVMFLALLELVRIGTVSASQQSWREDIRIGVSERPRETFAPEREAGVE